MTMANFNDPYFRRPVEKCVKGSCKTCAYWVIREPRKELQVCTRRTVPMLSKKDDYCKSYKEVNK